MIWKAKGAVIMLCVVPGPVRISTIGFRPDVVPSDQSWL